MRKGGNIFAFFLAESVASNPRCDFGHSGRKVEDAGTMLDHVLIFMWFKSEAKILEIFGMHAET